ncbi:MAG: hypothetical protein LC104_03030 [Bacteroidales bacterium]|nr:hypothetical protein [Bacteroidales bacterium]
MAGGVIVGVTQAICRYSFNGLIIPDSVVKYSGYEELIERVKQADREFTEAHKERA